jgi:hypothetical protein
MTSKNLPAYLRQVLENHVEQSQLTHDEELQGIYDKLTRLNERVETIKATIKQRRLQSK